MPTVKTQPNYQKLFNLSPEAQFYLGSDLNGVSNQELAKDFDLPLDTIHNLMFDLIDNDFNFDFFQKQIKNLPLGLTFQKNFQADFVGKLLLPLQGQVASDFKVWCQKLGIDPLKYQKYVDDFEDLIDEENIDILDEAATKAESFVNLQEEKDILIDLLTNGLVGILKNNHHDSVIDLNSGLIYCLKSDGAFQDKLQKILLSSPEIISQKNLVLEDKEEPGSVANWLKDFIKNNGSEIPSSVVLSRYISEGANTKALSDEEKKTLRKLLHLYKNLVFFPDSLANLPMADWEIIPFDKDAGSEAPSKILKPIKAPVQTQALEIEPEKEPVVKGALRGDEPLDSLEKMLAKYPPHTLEHKVIKEQLKKED